MDNKVDVTLLELQRLNNEILVQSGQLKRWEEEHNHALEVYAQSDRQHVERLTLIEKQYKSNRLIAWIGAAIALAAILANNLIPIYFQP